MPRRIRPDAVSRSRPVGLPALSFRISPPAGLGVLAVTFDHLHRLAHSRTTRGRWRASGSPDCSARPCRAIRAWETLRRSATVSTSTSPDAIRGPRSTGPASRFPTASATILHDLVPALRVHQLEAELARPMPVKCPCPSMKPGIAIWPCQIDHFRVRPDVAWRSPRWSRAPRCVPHVDSNRLRLRRPLIERDHAAVVEHQFGRRGLRGRRRLARQSHAGEDGDDEQRRDNENALRVEEDMGIQFVVADFMGTNAREKLPPKMACRARARIHAEIRRQSASCSSKIARCQPRGKNDESVPNRIRDGPMNQRRGRTRRAGSVPGESLIQLFELEVSR